MVVLKRKINEIWVNNYNSHFMKVWGTNMDIQFCMDTYAVITYIKDYLTKGEAGLTSELKKALYETKNCNNFEMLNHLKMVYFKHKQVSVAEATYKLIKGLDLKKSNIACIYVATGYPKNRSTFFIKANSSEKSVDDEILLGEEQSIAETKSVTVTIEGKLGKFREVETIHKKYSQRPEILDDCCLAQFATSYTNIKEHLIPKKIGWEKSASIEEGDLNEFISQMRLPKYIELFDSGTFMSLRSKPLVLRIHSSKKKEYLEGVYSELLLYFPWRNETELKEGKDEDILDLFNRNEEIISRNKRNILPNAPMVNSMMELLDAPEDSKPLHIADGIAPTNEQTNLDDQIELDETNPLDTSDLPNEAGLGDKKAPKKVPDGTPYRPLPLSSQNELIEKARSLSFNQKIVFDMMVAFAKSVIRAEKAKAPMSILPPPSLNCTWRWRCW